MLTIKPKKTPYYVMLFSLTVGASLILGFLSFGGMFALWPLLAPAIAAFVLSVAYEGEIYLQNIKGALKKLFRHDYLKRELAKEYLLHHFPDTKAEGCPQFFKDYEAQLHILNQYSHEHLNDADEKRKKSAEKKLRDMEKWFAIQAFGVPNATNKQTTYEQELARWLANNQQTDLITKFNQRRRTFRWVKGFSLFSGLFMGLGTTYLLVEAFAAIPAFAALSMVALPAIVSPLAVIAGAAYGLLTYNAVTEMIENDTLRKWYKTIRDGWKEGFSWRALLTTTAALFLVAIAVALTACTAGTWWTVAKNTRSLFVWMSKMPSAIMGIINPIITGLSAVVFNLQNTAETLGMITHATEKHEHKHTHGSGNFIKRWWSAATQNETLWQVLNPFRLIVKLCMTPLRILLFLGHLVSIGVAGDRVPGIPQTVSALLGIISEGFEDVHYFFGHSHHTEDADTACLLKERLSASHGHHHGLDIPSLLLKVVFAPLMFIAALWDYAASRNGPKPLSLVGAFKKQLGIKEPKQVEIKESLQDTSDQWQVQHAIHRIERHKEKTLQSVMVGRDIARQKCEKLTELQNDLRELKDPTTLSTRLADEDKSKYNQHRFFGTGTTHTEEFLINLPNRVSAAAA